MSEVTGYIRSLRLRLHLELNLNLDLEHRTASTSDSFIVRLFLLILRVTFFSWQVPWKPPTCCQINPRLISCPPIVDLNSLSSEFVHLSRRSRAAITPRTNPSFRIHYPLPRNILVMEEMSLRLFWIKFR